MNKPILTLREMVRLSRDLGFKERICKLFPFGIDSFSEMVTLSYCIKGNGYSFRKATLSDCSCCSSEKGSTLNRKNFQKGVGVQESKEEITKVKDVGKSTRHVVPEPIFDQFDL